MLCPISEVVVASVLAVSCVIFKGSRRWRRKIDRIRFASRRKKNFDKIVIFQVSFDLKSCNRRLRVDVSLRWSDDYVAQLSLQQIIVICQDK